MSIYATTLKLSPEPAVPGLQAWSNLVERIQRGDPSAREELYKTFARGIPFLLYRRLGPQDLDDKVHDVFVIVTEAICRGELREPERLMGYVHTVVRRQVAAHIGCAVHQRHNRIDVDQEFLSDKRPDPEREALDRQHLNLAMSVLQT